MAGRGAVTVSSPAGEKIEGVGQDVDDGLKALLGPRWGSGDVHHESAAASARSAPRQATERTDRPHRFSETRGHSIENDRRAFRSEVSGAKSSTPRGNDETKEAVTEIDEGLTHVFPSVGHHPDVLDGEPGGFKHAGDGGATAIFGGARRH